jgi:hypothetical protein
MKKLTKLLKVIWPLLALISGACQQSFDKVPFSHQNPPISASLALDYEGFVVLVEQQATFLLTITNSRCTCTSEFMPLYDNFIEANNIAGYTLEYTEVLYEPVKHGLPVIDSNSPILTIYQDGNLKYSLTYKIGDANFNRPFTDYDALSQYLEARIDVS